jgi:hypothetical protein
MIGSMLPRFLRLIGINEEVLKHLDRAELMFQNGAVLWIGLVLLLPLAWTVYRRQKVNLHTLPIWLLTTLCVTRVSILALLFLVLSGPYLRIDHKFERKPIVAFAFDHSQSMRLPVGPFASDEELAEAARAAGVLPNTPTGSGSAASADPQETSRSEPSAAATTSGQAPLVLDSKLREQLSRLTRAELAQIAMRVAYKQSLQPLADKFEVQHLAFARNIEPFVFDPAKSEPQLPDVNKGPASWLGSLVQHVVDEAAGQKIAGIVLFSDGQNTGGRSPAEAARAAAQANAPVFAVPVGSSKRWQDVSIVDLYSTGQVTVGDTVRVAVTLESHGFNGRPVRVELKDGDNLLDVKELVLLGTEQQQTELIFEAREAGDKYLTVNVPPFEEEAVELHVNNSDLAFVRVSDEKLKVLVIDGLPRWDFRFLKNAIRRDNGIRGRDGDEPDVVVEAEWRRMSSAEQASRLPSGVQEFSEYHTIVLGDVSPDLLSDTVRQALIEAVRDNGVGLIVQAGPRFMPQMYDREFQSLLPVMLRDNAEGGMEAPAYKPFKIEITAEGLLHESLRLHDDPGRNMQVWSQMPSYFWSAAVERPNPAAIVLARNPSLENRWGQQPLIAYQFAGKGKVAFVGTDATYLWRQNVGDRFFYKFWGQMLRFVGRTDDASSLKESRLFVRPVRVQPGESAEVELFAVTTEGQPRTDATLKVNTLGPTGTETVELVADRFHKGRYTGKFTPKEIGDHRVVYKSGDAARTVESRVRVRPSSEELRDPNINRPLLETLASTTGGKVISIADLATLPELLKGEPLLIEIHREASLWDNWFTLLLITLIYAVDVGLRRLSGLS